MVHALGNHEKKCWSPSYQEQSRYCNVVKFLHCSKGYPPTRIETGEGAKGTILQIVELHRGCPVEPEQSVGLRESAAQSAWEYPVREEARQPRLPAREIEMGQTSFPLLAIANEAGVSHSRNGFRVELGCCLHPQLRGTGRRSSTQV